ncbi:glutaredoxin-like protein NrdH [Nanchangia anserum]|uniref:Glutaredoxin-like protein NrdH n=1 Tax=Nanchangia anserum TaxID=2692125 RepID=A0A8I0G9U1_9ACTO|nr:glutaredoxin-like protein NrdH [Nanchangia anserum]MBD3689804.1 glutaredoxin-like protein NrdH [Nanchangia anserum]QOX81976.1 glutaredoxin-like protein NrdH [Nanchangia anserum]
MSITLYSKPRCVQCDATKRAFAKQGIVFTEIDMTVDAQALDYVKSLGFTQAPVVVADGDSWSGFRPDKIKGVATELARMTA